MSQPLSAGFARRDITPQLGSLLMGYPVADRRAETVRDSLQANGLVLQQGDKTAAILSLDVCVVDDKEVELIRREIESKTGIPSEAVAICAIQTHSGPRTIEVWGWCERDEPYLESMVEQSIEAIVQAQANLVPVKVGIGTTQSAVGINRRTILADHSVGLGVNPWGIYDPEMTVLRFEGDAGPLVSLVHYGAHPTVLAGESRGISRDWPGVMIDRIEQLTGTPAFFINGAVGDVAPRTNTARAVGDGEMALMEAGGRAATDALKAHRAIKEFRHLDLEATSGSFLLPYRPLPPAEEARQQLEAAEPNKDQFGKGMCDYRHWQAVLEAHNAPAQTGKEYKQVLLRLGPVALVPFPGEPFAETVLRLRDLSPAQYTLCASTSCGHNGYFATRESLHRGGYEVWVARAMGARILAENIDDVLVEANLNLLRQLYP